MCLCKLDVFVSCVPNVSDCCIHVGNPYSPRNKRTDRLGKKVGARIESRNRTAALLLMMMACAFAVPLPLGMTGSKQQRMDITSACSALFAAVAFMVAHFFFFGFPCFPCDHLGRCCCRSLCGQCCGSDTSELANRLSAPKAACEHGGLIPGFSLSISTSFLLFLCFSLCTVEILVTHQRHACVHCSST